MGICAPIAGFTKSTKVMGVRVMGSYIGGPDMITGKTVGRQWAPQQPYEDWLLEGVIQFGTGTIDIRSEWWVSDGTYASAAQSIRHIELQIAEVQLSGVVITKKAFDYLEYYGKVIDSKGET